MGRVLVLYSFICRDSRTPSVNVKARVVRSTVGSAKLVHLGVHRSLGTVARSVRSVRGVALARATNISFLTRPA